MRRTCQGWYDWCMERGTRGDQVFDILKDWGEQERNDMIRKDYLHIVEMLGLLPLMLLRIRCDEDGYFAGEIWAEDVLLFKTNCNFSPHEVFCALDDYALATLSIISLADNMEEMT